MKIKHELDILPTFELTIGLVTFLLARNYGYKWGVIGGVVSALVIHTMGQASAEEIEDGNLSDTGLIGLSKDVNNNVAFHPTELVDNIYHNYMQSD